MIRLRHSSKTSNLDKKEDFVGIIENIVSHKNLKGGRTTEAGDKKCINLKTLREKYYLLFNLKRGLRKCENVKIQDLDGYFLKILPFLNNIPWTSRMIFWVTQLQPVGRLVIKNRTNNLSSPRIMNSIDLGGNQFRSNKKTSQSNFRTFDSFLCSFID